MLGALRRRRGATAAMLFAGVLAVVLHPLPALPAPAVTITFEEAISQPQTVTKQYCLDPATNKGVEFLGHGGRIYEPPATSPPNSGTHAFTNAFPGQEFGFEGLAIAFTAAQSEVSVRVGLDKAHPAEITARLQTFSSITPAAGAELKTDVIVLGQGPTPINRTLSVSDSSPAIRSAVVEFSAPSGGPFTNYVPVVIDDLSFSTAGAPCVTDTSNPVVSIWQPKAATAVVYLPTLDLGFTAADPESGVARIQVIYSTAAGQELGSFDYCGGPLTKPCGPPFNYILDHFIAQLLPGTERIRVVATDFAGHQGADERIVAMNLPGPNANLWLQGIEVTQGIQNYVPVQQTTRRASAPAFAPANAAGYFPAEEPYTSYVTNEALGAPLVAGRTTVVRVYPAVEGTAFPIVGATVGLKCFRDEAYTQPCPDKPELTPIKVDVWPNRSLEAKRGDKDASANFVLPFQWTYIQSGFTGSVAAEIYLEASVTAPPAASECAGCEDDANRFRLGRVRFYHADAFANRVTMRGFNLLLDGVSHPLSTTELTAALDFIRRIWPADEHSVPAVVSMSPVPYAETLKTPDEERCNKFLNTVKGLGYSDDFPIIGLIDGALGCRSRGNGDGYAMATVANSTTAAHELGHTFDLSHAGPPPGHSDECTTGGTCDGGWPFPHGTIGDFGWDILAMRPIVPGTLESDPHDVMSYGDARWIARRNWVRLFNRFTGKGFAALTSPDRNGFGLLTGADGIDPPAFAIRGARAPVVQDGRRLLLVRGRADERGAWSLLPLYELPPGATHPAIPGARDEGDYAIDLVGARGEVLATYRFTPGEDIVEDLDTGRADVAPPAFDLAVPLPEGVQSVVLRRETRVLARQDRTRTAPQLNLISPTENGFLGQPDSPRIRWAAFDADGDPLSFLVEYRRESGDGDRSATDWQTLAIDVTDTELPLVLAALPGGSAAQVRVSVTDGFNTTTVTSPAFAVADKAPVARILLPAPQTAITQGEALALRGAASDLEDGVLDGGALSWSSDVDGPLGSGPAIEVSTLSVGRHLITLTARDSAGQTGTASVGVEVQARLNTQPVAAAGPDQRSVIGARVSLDGTGSYDADGDPLTYRWTVVSRPPQSDAPLQNPDTPRPTLMIDRPGTYVIELRVHDGQVLSLPDRVAISAIPAAPDLTPMPTPPAAPTRFYGSVTLDGRPAPDGTITGLVGATTCGTGPIAGGSYVLDVVSAATRPGCGTDGATVSFMIGAVRATTTGAFAGGQFVSLNISATSQPPPLAPTSTPTPAPTATPTPACPPLGMPTLQAVHMPGNQVRVTWQVSGGCGPFTGTLSAQYVDQPARYAAYPVRDSSGVVMDTPPTRCEGTFTVRYTLNLRDSSGQSSSATTVQSVLWLC